MLYEEWMINESLTLIQREVLFFHMEAAEKTILDSTRRHAEWKHFPYIFYSQKMYNREGIHMSGSCSPDETAKHRKLTCISYEQALEILKKEINTQIKKDEQTYQGGQSLQDTDSK